MVEYQFFFFNYKYRDYKIRKIMNMFRKHLSEHLQQLKLRFLKKNIFSYNFQIYRVKYRLITGTGPWGNLDVIALLKVTETFSLETHISQITPPILSGL